MKTPSVKCRQRATFVILIPALLIAGLSLINSPSAHAAPPDPARAAFVNLFMWKWKDVARECETYLGPKGFAAVQISPPEEHIQGSFWWIHYQPVSYQVESELGTRTDFQDMVARCNSAGVKIYADVVINHMAAGSGTGYAGSAYSNTNHWYTFPGIYQGQDFHWNVAGSHNCQSDVNNYDNQHAVQDCELLGLPDLATETPYVNGRLADYLVDLYNLGVRGFRVDAAKHIDAVDISTILSNFKSKIGNKNDYYVVQEVIDPGNEAVKKDWYYPNGDVNEFLYGKLLKQKFVDQRIADLSTFGATWTFGSSTLGPGDKMVVFPDNHDMERGGDRGDYLHYRDDGQRSYTLANVFMLAWPYGYPQVYSGYQFDPNTQAGRDQGRPAVDVYVPNSGIQPTNCQWSGGPWTCVHHWREIGNMVGFRNAAGSDAVANWWDNGNNQIAFGRGNKGFVVINHENAVLNRAFQTGLPAGTYCDIIAGDWNGSTCSDRTLTVDGSGLATISVPANYAAAIHVGAKLSVLKTTSSLNVSHNSRHVKPLSGHSHTLSRHPTNSGVTTN
ncbi:MAG TPA: alpha-amylase family protein [Gallionella sp.]|nr:alpha-amylase family protein [Gallionella sp.]